MEKQKKINKIKYLMLSIFPYLLGLLADPHLKAVYAYFIIYLCVVLNHVLLIKATSLMLEPSESKKNAKIFGMFIIKTAILFLGISLGVHFIGTKVIIPVLFYVYQIFILIYSLKRA